MRFAPSLIELLAQANGGHPGGAAAANAALAHLGTPSLAMWGTAAGVLVLIAVLAWIYGPARRRRVRVAFMLMLGWAAGVIVWLMPFLAVGLRDTCELVALVCLALAAVRAVWLLVVDIGLKGGEALGVSQISRDIVQATIYIVTAIAAARAAGADAQSVATTGGLVTAGLTFSLQQTLGDLVAGLLLQAQAPFKVGDWIAYSDNPRQIGRVAEINWRATKVVTNDQIEVTVPNSLLGRAQIVNFVEPSPVMRRMFRFEVGYQHPPRVVQQAALAAARDVEGVRASPQPVCWLIEFAGSAIAYHLVFFIDDVERREPIDSDVRVRLWYALRRAGIEFQFPRQELSLIDDAAARLEQERVEHARRLEVFDAIDVLAPLSREERARLAKTARTQLFVAGEPIVREGERSTEMFVIEQGEAVVVADRGRREIARLGPRDFFGEMALLTGEARTATVRAATDCVACVIDKPTLEAVLAGHPGLLGEISHVVAERQRENARRRGEPDETRDQQALRESSLLAMMKRFFAG